MQTYFGDPYFKCRRCSCSWFRAKDVSIANPDLECKNCGHLEKRFEHDQRRIKEDSDIKTLEGMIFKLVKGMDDLCVSCKDYKLPLFVEICASLPRLFKKECDHWISLPYTATGRTTVLSVHHGTGKVKLDPCPECEPL